VHGNQQLSLFNAHYNERCFLPIHVYDIDRSRPVAVVCDPGKRRPACAHLRRLAPRMHQRWVKSRIAFRGDCR
jgi:hypothetical protein